MNSRDLGFSFGGKAFRLYDRELYLLDRLKVQFVYGQREILLDFADVGRDHLIKAYLQHGVLDSGINVVSEHLPRFRAPRTDLGRRVPFLVYNSETQNQLRSFGANAMAVGAPYLYISELRSVVEVESNHRPKTLVFPRHGILSHPHTPRLTDILKMIKLWREQADSDIVICLFWVEFLDSVWHEACKLSKVELITLGVGEVFPYWGNSPRRIKFLYSLNQVLKDFDRVLTNDVTSAIFYALYEGKEVGVFPHDSRVLEDQDNYESALWENLLRIIPGCINKFIEAPKYRDRVNKILGVESKMDAPTLKKSLPTEPLRTLSKLYLP